MTVVKAILAAVAAVLAAVLPALTVAPLDFAGWVNVVILAAGAVMVYNASNDVPGWPYAKLIASIVSAVAVVLVSSLSGGITTAEVVQMIVAGIGAVVVGVVPNGGRVAAA